MVNSTVRLKRADVPIEQTCDTASLFASWQAWQTELEDVKSSMSKLADFAGKLGDNPSTLAQYLELVTAYSERLYRLGNYAGTLADVDATDKDALAKRGQLMGVVAMFNATVSFADPEMLALGDTLQTWATQDAQLAPYAHYFDNLLRQKPHSRSSEVEKILSMVQEPFAGVWSTMGVLTNAELKFADAKDSAGNPQPVSHATIPPNGIQSSDREHRRTAWESYCDGYLAFQNTLASNYLMAVQQQIFMRRVRGYDSVLHAMLAPYNLPVEVFHNLIDTFKANLGTWHRYWGIKAKAIGVETLHPYDIWAPLTANDPKIPYTTGVEWIAKGMQPLGDEYVGILKRGCLEERWVDYANNAGKMQGARSGLAVDCKPFIVMSYNDSLMDMSVLAHELGHSMHHYLMDQHQPLMYKRDVSMIVAETASNFNQALTRAHLIEANADNPDFQLALIGEAIYNFHRYFFIMPTLARFEYEVFDRAENGKPLNADILNGIMREMYQDGYGDSMAGDYDHTQITWAQFGHLYAPFYTFQYAVGISAAHALSHNILSGQAGSAESYLAMLRAGDSRYPLEVFALGGVDMTTPEPVEKAFTVLNGLIDRLEHIVGA